MRKWLEKLRQMKKDQILIMLLAGILLLVIAVPAEPSGKSESLVVQNVDETEFTEKQGEKEKLEQQLQLLLTQVDGVGKAGVMIVLKSDGKKIVEKDREQSQSKEEGNGEGQVSSGQSSQSSENTVYQKDSQGNEIPYVTEREFPDIAGVLIIAQGGGDASVKQEITEAVMALFGVEAHKIKVMRMK